MTIYCKRKYLHLAINIWVITQLVHQPLQRTIICRRESIILSRCNVFNKHPIRPADNSTPTAQHTPPATYAHALTTSLCCIIQAPEVRTPCYIQSGLLTCLSAHTDLNEQWVLAISRNKIRHKLGLFNADVFHSQTLPTYANIRTAFRQAPYPFYKCIDYVLHLLILSYNYKTYMVHIADVHVS
jgi:hypothetical protein